MTADIHADAQAVLHALRDPEVDRPALHFDFDAVLFPFVRCPMNLNNDLTDAECVLFALARGPA